MKKFITKIVFFFVIIAVFDTIFGRFSLFVFSNAKGGSTKPMQFLMYECNKDIVIMGSSRAHAHYDDYYLQQSLGVGVYNAGCEGMGIINMYAKYKLLTKHYKPQILVYDIEPAFDIYDYKDDNGGSRYTSSLRPFASDVDIKTIITDVSPIDNLKLISGLYRNNTIWLSYVKDAISGSFSGFGFSPASGSMEEAIGFRRKNDELLDINLQKIKYFNKLVEETERDGVQLIIVASPKYGATSDSLRPIIDICKENEVLFLNFTETPMFQKTEYFRDPMHLNEKGAHVFDKELIKYIKIVMQNG